MIPESEWLKEAKRLHVGEAQRIYHGAEKRPNLVIQNKPDRWIAYCHRCHEGAVVMKELVKIGITPPAKKERNAHSPGQLWPVTLDAPALNVPIAEIVNFLHTKDMSLMLIKDANPMYSPSDQRLVFSTPDATIGRDLTGTSKSKWYSYQVSEFCRASYKPFSGNTIVLTEDYFSALKAQYYAPQNGLAVAMLGTELRAGLTVELCKAAEVVVATDADQAGDTAAVQIKRTLDLLGIKNRRVRPTDGLDPKNMQEEYFNQVWNSMNT